MGTAGIIPPTDEFLSAARELTQAAGALLIVDEVITFRLGRGGAQQRLGIEPDLTTLGKVIGGGLPVGAVGGSASLMEVLTPGAEKAVSLSGTFNGNAATMAAGLATLELLDDEAFARLDTLGDRLVEGLRAVITRHGAPAQVTSIGSLVNIHFTEEKLLNAGASLAADADSAAVFHLGLLNRGIFIATRGLFAVSTVTTEAEIDRTVEVAGEMLAALA
jgi:glutamate-1-semialdehyde 2,1-aminomutase